MGREKFSSSLGFILISAGCAIGLGNVWRFPYIVGQYGGAAFVLIFAVFLLILGLPIVVMEFAVGRASQKSIALSYDVLEPEGSKWHYAKYLGMAGNYILMMFYTTVSGWMAIKTKRHTIINFVIFSTPPWSPLAQIEKPPTPMMIINIPMRTGFASMFPNSAATPSSSRPRKYPFAIFKKYKTIQRETVV